MGGGNGQKAKMAREKNAEKMKGQKGNACLCFFFGLYIQNFKIKFLLAN